MNWKKFCSGDKAVFFGDKEGIKRPNGTKIKCDLVYGKKYKVEGITFWGSMEFLKLKGNKTFWQESMFCSPKEWKKINKFISGILN